MHTYAPIMSGSHIIIKASEGSEHLQNADRIEACLGLSGFPALGRSKYLACRRVHAIHCGCNHYVINSALLRTHFSLVHAARFASHSRDNEDHKGLALHAQS